ncbi:Putative protein [Zobellia galactanivorans]|uniref:Uncharacterized protein n=1 Tax=Zobellia galactanivorans (strain DSM 12802 / CCUG 47099 / CIP 106680 / NCIMB 13871 / Dsij) TaxID=63186 RepID=G0L8H2_ZOBGA|nr:Putative protein [Zobellia galactanivorans]
MPSFSGFGRGRVFGALLSVTKVAVRAFFNTEIYSVEVVEPVRLPRGEGLFEGTTLT